MALRRVAFALCLSLLVCEAALAEKPLTNDDVIKLAGVGIGDEAVIAKIRQAAAVDFKLETDDLVKLKAAGVSGKVIAAMLDRANTNTSAPAAAPAAARTDGPFTPDQIEADLLQSESSPRAPKSE